MMKEQISRELTEHIIPFWNALRDDENGGFYGFMDSDLKLDKNGEKGVILHSRILWFPTHIWSLRTLRFLTTPSTHTNSL